STTAFRRLRLRKTLKYCPGLVDHYNEFKDIAPWKFKRRLSCLCRPMIPVGGNRYLSSAFLLRQGIGYFLDLARDGLFIPSFFSSKAMQSYVGKKTGERGLWFNEVVAQTLTENGFEQSENWT
ncbi:hypothetical protein NLU14_21295, partial [Marinobacter sp. 71-i]